MLVIKWVIHSRFSSSSRICEIQKNISGVEIRTNDTKYCIKCHLLFKVYTMLYAFTINVILLPNKMLMFYNVQRISLTFVGKKNTYTINL